MWSYLLRCRLQKRPHLFKKKKKKESLPTLPNFFWSGNPKHTYYLFGPTKHAKHFEKIAELTYVELTQGRESTRYLTRTNLRH